MGKGKESKMIIDLALFAALLLFLGLGSWKINRDVERKVRRLKTHQEPRLKEREDYWAA